MTCPRCYAEFESGPGICPECGVRLLHNTAGLMKTSAVMIATAAEKGFYRSVRDVPEGLRQELLRVTTGENCGTIVIADRAGKEQLTQTVARRDAVKGRIAKVPASGVATNRPAGSAWLLSRPGLWARSWVFWAGIALLCGSAGVVAAVFTLRW